MYIPINAQMYDYITYESASDLYYLLKAVVENNILKTETMCRKCNSPVIEPLYINQIIITQSKAHRNRPKAHTFWQDQREGEKIPEIHRRVRTCQWVAAAIVGSRFQDEIRPAGSGHRSWRKVLTMTPLLRKMKCSGRWNRGNRKERYEWYVLQCRFLILLLFFM